jgi:hypothetical protein
LISRFSGTGATAPVFSRRSGLIICGVIWPLHTR